MPPSAGESGNVEPARPPDLVERAIDRVPCGVVSFSDDGRISAVNATLLERLGYTREELLGSHVERIFTLAGRLFYQTHFFPLVRMQGRAQELFLLLRTKNGEEVGMLTNAARHTTGDKTWTDCVFFEVRERRKYEEALLQAKRTAEQAQRQLEEQALELELQHQQLQEQATELEVQSAALQELNDTLIDRTTQLEHQQAAAEEAQRVATAANHAKSEFLAVMSHELRTPLNAIGGYTQLLESGVYGPVSEVQNEALGRIVRSQRHLLGLINDVLNLARIETGRVEYSIESVGISEVLDELAPMIEPQMAAKQLVYDVVPPEPGLSVCADREKLVQILLNILSNAVKFTPKGGTIELRAAVHGARVVIDVTDTGRGIPAEKLEAIFEPFVQVRSGRTSTSEGTGLGLSISRNLAQGMGGDLTATSTPGEGSTFTLTLPRA